MSCTCLSSRNVKIKKQRKCFACLRLFPTGTRMKYYVGIYEGDFQTSYSCMTCVEILNMYPDTDGEGYPEGFVKEMLLKDETPEQLIKRLNEPPLF